jgi:hypothetical protein
MCPQQCGRLTGPEAQSGILHYPLKRTDRVWTLIRFRKQCGFRNVNETQKTQAIYSLGRDFTSSIQQGTFYIPQF